MIDGTQQAENSHNHGANDDSKRGKFLSGITRAEWLIIFFTAVTALAAWAGVWVAQGQWGVADKQRIAAAALMSTCPARWIWSDCCVVLA